MNEETREPQPPAEPQNTATSAGAAVKEQPRPAPPKADRLPPFRVLLHNDDVNGMEHVVETIVDLTPHSVPMATTIMLEAHTKGVALLLVTHRERAELYVDQFKSRNLVCTFEATE